MGPNIALYNADHSNLVSTWNVGTVKAQEPSSVLTINVWNNKGQATDVSDLKDCSITVYDADGINYVQDVAKDKWVEINVPSVDGNDSTWSRIGGVDAKPIRANSGASDFSIKGVANNGTVSNTDNFATVNLRINAPINSTPGNKTFKVRLTGYYT